jgi:hypothetical protein
MIVEVQFPRTATGMRVDQLKFSIIPRVGEYISTNGDDCWRVDTVIHYVHNRVLRAQDPVAQIRVR